MFFNRDIVLSSIRSRLVHTRLNYHHCLNLSRCMLVVSVSVRIISLCSISQSSGKVKLKFFTDVSHHVGIAEMPNAFGGAREGAACALLLAFLLTTPAPVPAPEAVREPPDVRREL